MTDLAPAPTERAARSIKNPRLPQYAPLIALVVAVAASALLGLTLGWGVIPIGIVAAIFYLIGLTTWSRIIENARAATDRLVTSLVWVSLTIALIPLVSLLWKVIDEGKGALNGKFLTYSMRNVIGEPGGIYHAIMGTLLITLAAAVISVPIGLLAAVYLVEYGAHSQLARWIRFLVDVMTGIPSIVAGLFAYALFSLIVGPGTQFGIGGGVALSILMIPIVVRSSEEMLKLVPADLREASYALGVPKWKTILKVVIPTAMAGIITGVTLAIARVIGETAPLLIICGATDSVNLNLFHGQMASLPVFIYGSYTQPGSNPEILKQMAWGAALILILIVMALNILARVLGKLFSPKTGH
ncbi:phosphate ABC transporter permease PstA [Nocardioides marmoriginsengisoli]|uniref:Phosphate transport system permease protein PstA n=1 Tax=Nocardioides marmoriginsengisoli TaxID=661483 RepID=A0A3N0CT20_9ACTN|nr:phosphate ABC transporter permease PstA [Nocardioides marmoriginsengisoli]RNL66063.1 phosphate ABC transporter permease PstA [Nocardioides marmoriginsengisoli]